MELPTVAPLDLHSEYFRTLLATKVAATVFILFAAVLCFSQYQAQSQAVQIFENMVTGGMDAMPKLTRLVWSSGDSIIGLALVIALCGLVFIWPVGRSISRVIYAGTIAVAALLLAAILFSVAYTMPMQTIFTKFNG